jgi:Ala-tRNA(Pro) deacylase
MDTPEMLEAMDASSKFEDTLPTRPGEIIALLESLGVSMDIHHHAPLRTVADSQNLRGEIDGAHIKNLYLRDNKKNNYLIVADETLAIDLKELAPKIGASRLSFGSADRLMEFLGVRPGAVSPLTLCNDTELRVQLVMDRSLLDAEKINVHPLVNDMTLTVPVAGLEVFFDHTGHKEKRIQI